MSKTLLFVCPGVDYLTTWDELSVKSGAVGGTETMLIEITAALSKLGYRVILVGEPDIWHISTDGVEYISFSDAVREYSEVEFDVGFFYFIDNIRIFNCKKNILIPSCELIQENGLDFGKDVDTSLFDKVFYLSDWQRDEIHNEQGVGIDKLVYVPNCVGYTDLYSNALSYEKENAMVWSSRYERNFEFFMDMVYPKIAKYYPDFKVYLCGYIDKNRYVSDKYKDCNVEILGKLDKKTLSEYQKRSKIWIYPNVGINFDEEKNWLFHETFCITAVENLLARNAIICFGGGKDGITTTLEGYDLIPGGIFKEHETFFLEDKEAVANCLAGETFRCLQEEDYWYKKVDGDAYKKLKDKYTIDNVVKYWIKAIEDE